MSTTYCSTIAKHYESKWSTPMISVPFTRGPIEDLPQGFGVLAFPPRGERTMWKYATRCMSTPDDVAAIELHMFAAERDDDSIAELLVACAHYHRTGRTLNLGHTVNFGRPWFKGSTCGHGLISLPYLDGPSLEWLNVDGKQIHFLWLVPVTDAEVVFVREHGVDRLEQQFEESQFNYLDPLRRSVV